MKKFLTVLLVIAVMFTFSFGSAFAYSDAQLQNVVDSHEAAVKAINGESVEKLIDTGYAWYDKSNIDSDEIKPLLYE